MGTIDICMSRAMRSSLSMRSFAAVVSSSSGGCSCANTVALNAKTPIIAPASANWADSLFILPLLSVIFFLLEKNAEARVACMHTAVTSLAASVLGFLPTVFWLIILGATKGNGAFFVICTIIFVGILLVIGIVLLAVEITCGIKSLRKEPVEVPFITSWVAKIAKKI